MSQVFSDAILFKVAFSIPSDSEFGAAVIEVFRGENLVLGTVRVATVKSMDITGMKTVWIQDPWISYVRFILASFKKGKIDFRTTKEFTEILHKTFAPYIHSYLDGSSGPFEGNFQFATQQNNMELLGFHEKENYSSIVDKIFSSLAKGRAPDKVPIVICSSEMMSYDEYQQIRDRELEETLEKEGLHNPSFMESIIEGLPPESMLVDCRPVVSAASGMLVYALRAGMDIMVGIPWDMRNESLIRYLAQESGITVDASTPFIQPARVVSTKATSRGVVICVHLRDNFYGKLDEVEPIKIKIAPPGAYIGPHEKKEHASQEGKRTKKNTDNQENKSSVYYQDTPNISSLHYLTTIGFIISVSMGFLLAYFLLW